MSGIVVAERTPGMAAIRMNRQDRMNAHNRDMGEALLAEAPFPVRRPLTGV